MKKLFLFLLSCVCAQAATLQSYPTVTTPAGDDWLYIQGATNNVRKLSPLYYATSASVTSSLSGLASIYQPLDADLTALAAVSGTNTIYYRSAANTWSPVAFSGATFAGGTLTITASGSGDVVAANANAFTGANTFAGTSSFTGAIIQPATAMPALNVDFSKGINTYAASSNVSFTYNSGTPPATGTWTTVEITADSSDRTITIPTTYSFGRGGNITSLLVTANNTLPVRIKYNLAKTRYEIIGDPVLTSGTGSFALTTGATFNSPLFAGVASATYASGKLVFDTDNDSLTFFNSDSAVAMQIGQEEWIRVVNSTGSTIPNGAPVYISGSSAGLPTIALAKADAAATSLGAGLATESIANGATGFVTRGGLVRGIDTSAFSTGPIYISAATAGALTQTAPSAPNFRYRVGYVVTVSASVGSIDVTPSTSMLGNGTANQVFGMNTGATAQEMKSLNGTANEITSTGGTGTITFSLPSALTFTGKTITGGTFSSPTLTTPALGTPTALVLTNATSVPAGQINGVIPIANLATGTPNGAKFIRDDGTLATPGGSGTVTASGGSLTANSVVLGAGTTDTKVAAGITTDGTSKLTLGVAGTSVGSVDFKNATSGTATLAPPTGALGTFQVTLPNAASTLPIFGQQVTFAGPTAARTVTLPDAAFTVARTDAANTFTGASSATSWTMTTPILSGSVTGTYTLAGTPTFPATVPLTSAANIWTAANTFTPTARSSGVASFFTITTPADTGQTAATESIGVNKTAATRTWATTGTVALQREVFLAGPTYASASASQTFTDAFNLYLTPPVAGTNAIFTRGHSLGIVDSTSAASSITGGLVVSTTLGTTATSVGIGGGNVNAGGTITAGGVVTASTTIELGNATDTTLARVAAGQISVEGVNVTTVSSTDTLTNKRVTARTNTITSSATPAINTDTTDEFTITAQAVAITSMTTSLTGTPVNGDQLLIRFLDNGSAQTIAWGASFQSIGGTLPTTTVSGKLLYVLLIWNSTASKWDCVSTSQQP